MSFIDDSESFEDSYTDDEETEEQHVGLAHVRRLEQENESVQANYSNTKQLKLVGGSGASISEPSSKKPRLSTLKSERKLNLSGCQGSGDTLMLVSESFNEFFPRKHGPVAASSSDSGKSKKVPKKPNLFANVSDEVIVKIFAYLNRQSLGRCALVCKRFRQIAYDESFWKRIRMYNKTVAPGVISQVLNRGTWYLSLAKATLTSPALKKPAPDRSKLKYLDLSACSLSHQDLQDLLETCHDLQKVSLEKIANVSLEVCKKLMQSAETLQILNLCDCSLLDSQGIKSIVNACRQLTEINLAFTNLSSCDIDNICQNLTPTLRKINLAGLRSQLSDANIKDLVQRCPDLQELDLSDASALTEEALNEIIESNLANTLNKLSLSRCFDIHPVKLLSLNSMKQLKHLNVFGMLAGNKIDVLKKELPQLNINESPLTYIARPTASSSDRRNLLWGVKIS